jgi:hypothetical protein
MFLHYISNSIIEKMTFKIITILVFSLTQLTENASIYFENFTFFLKAYLQEKIISKANKYLDVFILLTEIIHNFDLNDRKTYPVIT